MSEYRDKKRQGELNQQLKEGMIPSVTRSIHKELEQILARRKQRREEEKARVKKKAFVETKCHCGNMFMRKNLKGRAATHCPECRAALNKRNVPYAKRKTSRYECIICHDKVLHCNTVPHEGGLICAKCHRAKYDAIDKEEEQSMDEYIASRTMTGCGIAQMEELAVAKGQYEDTFETKRRYVKNKVSGVKK